MRDEIKVRTPHYWLEIPAATPIVALAALLADTRLRIRWNNLLRDCTGHRGFIELHHPVFSSNNTPNLHR
ncbi:MAG: hypothetical protein HC889_12940 [Synechococcaceae cyanobacterium SM1_2_3]|nr:hypothetical protein [Synechococcaceae cyanobacterium SM1_2_3]